MTAPPMMAGQVNNNGTAVGGVVAGVWDPVQSAYVAMTQPLSAGGNIGGFTATSKLAPPVTAGAYTAGMCVGGLLTITNAARASGGSGMLQNVGVGILTTAATPALDLVLFDAQPTASAFADHVAAVVNTADMAKIVPGGVISLTNVIALGGPNLIQADQLALAFDLAGGTSLFGILIARSAFTLGSVSDVTVSFGIIQD